MAPKRKAELTLEEALARVWCYYCERDFPALKDLCDHQRSKHFRCIYDPRSCNRKLQTAGGLKVHMQQVHKSDLKEVPDAMPGRAGLEPEIFAMDGIPQHLIEKHNDRIIKEYQMREAEYLKKTGNSLYGTNAPSKKPKVEVAAVPEDQIARARAFKEKKMLQRKLRDEAIARGEEPPKFDAIPAATTPAAPATPVAAPATESPAPPSAAVDMLPGGRVWSPPAQYQPSYNGPAPNVTWNPNSYTPFQPVQPYNSMPAYPPAAMGVLPIPHMPARPATDLSADRFREQHPLHGLPSLPPQPLANLPARPTGPSTVNLPSNDQSPAGKHFPLVPPDRKPTMEAATEQIYNMIDDNKRIVDAQKQMNEMSQKTVAQPDPKLNTSSSSVPPRHAPSTTAPAGMLMKNNGVSWEERRAEHPRYHARGPKVLSQISPVG